jgi:4-alpha-glucanotransferase
LISPELLARDELLPEGLPLDPPHFAPTRIDYAAVREHRAGILRASWQHVRTRGVSWALEELRSFVEAPEQAPWLADWTTFAALKKRHAGAAWLDWPKQIARREPAALAEVRRELEAAIEYQGYLQYLFFRQWRRLRDAARRRGIALFGDAPIYVAPDSADVWAHTHLFQLDADLRPTAVSGVPPDYFSDTGQLWGTPLYAWERHQADGFTWWIERVRANLRTCDLLRIDHFRAFSAYWSIAAGSTTAAAGTWIPAPGEELFRALRKALGGLPIVAEDLGVITDDVVALREALGLPGMKVMQFAFDEPDSEHLPHRHTADSVVYTGTHDNDTAAGWFARAGQETRKRALDYLGGDGREIHWDLIRATLTSVADRAVVPMQDVLGLGTEARMNEPALADGNWRWRLTDAQLDAATAARFRRLVEVSGRA